MTHGDLCFDYGREKRLGFPEIVYGEAKSVDQLQRIIAQCQERQHDILISRCQAEKAAELEGGHYDPVARTWIWQPEAPKGKAGKIGILSGGSADAPVVMEVKNTLGFLGIHADAYQDIGVAALERFLSRLDLIRSYDILVVVAGFEAALASVAAGQCPQPIIAVPTSVGYGVAEGGKAALSSMLASCANGVMVMNIDNGIGAALAAQRMLRLLEA